MRSSYLIPRRTVLRGFGISMGLPLLDIMSPALGAAARHDSNALRFCVLYKGCGVNPSSWDMPGASETWHCIADLCKWSSILTLTCLHEHRNRILLCGGSAAHLMTC